MKFVDDDDDDELNHYCTKWNAKQSCLRKKNRTFCHTNRFSNVIIYRVTNF